VSDAEPVHRPAPGSESYLLSDPPSATEAANRRARIGFAFVLLAAVLWSLLAVFSTEAQRSGLSPVEISFWRAAGGGALFLIQVIATRQPRNVGRRDIGRLAGFAIVGVALFFAALNFTIRAGGVSLTFVLLYTAPAFVAIGAWPILGERPTRRGAMLVALVIGGVALVALGRGEGVRVSAESIGWGLTSGVAYSTYYLVAKPLFERLGVALTYSWAFLGGAVVLFPFVTFAEKSLRAWAALAAIVVLSTWGANLAYGTGVSLVPASGAVLVATIEPVLAVALGAVFYSERFAFTGLIGAALVVAAALISARTAGSAPSSGPDIGTAHGHADLDPS
jgi:drug/metabolite transporter, DME family